MAKLQDWFHRYNAWSYTRHRLWEDCKKAYYYNYIGAALDGPTAFNVAKIKQLKKLDGRFVIQGKIIHEIIERFIQNHRSHKLFDEKMAREQYIAQLEGYRKSAKIRIIDYFNGAPISEYFFDRARENGLDQLSLFFGVIWPQIAGHKYLQHEQFDEFFLGAIKSIVKIDYVCRDLQNKIHIYDWKTGSDNEEYESDLQIAGYALWAQQKYRIESDQLQCSLVYLTSGAIKSYQFTAQQLNTVKELISSDYTSMNMDYEPESYPPSPDKKKCISCHFATICPSAVIEA
jgi:CRISPR/Cas system-associated exonuclease Cas4 (RecB family)